MTNKTRLLSLVCALAGSMAFSGCDDGDAVGSTHNPVIKALECTTNADCADKGDKTECSVEGICIAPAVTPECTTNEDCADKGDKTECNAEGVCVAPAVCDNGTLEEGEECDGMIIAENLDVDCGVNKKLVDNPVCIAGTCKIDLAQSCEEIPKECEVDDDCADKEEGKTKCNVEYGICVVPPECEVDDDCADKEEGKTKCDVDNGVCVVPPECEVDEDCADKEDGKTKCDVGNGVCVVPPECESHADCADKEDGRTRCDIASNTCYTPECEADDACTDNSEGKTKCDVENGVCIVPPECVADEDCAEKENNRNVCNLEKGLCVQCTQDVHCANCADNKTQCNITEGICVEPSVVVDPEKPITYKACHYPDEDKDGISDDIEGKAEGRDSDGDKIPDYQDLDSDNDTIPDSIEGGTGGCSSAYPIDSDLDGSPDYLDTDSDNNKILDSDECCSSDETCKNAKVEVEQKDGTQTTLFTYCIDTDNDTYPDYSDSDNDGDYISDMVEIVGMVNPKDTTLADDEFSGDCRGGGEDGKSPDGKPDKKGSVAEPIDCDNDTIPDYMDVDSDGDKISDVDEGQGLVSGGQFYSHYMTDTDGDGINDGVECGGTLDDNGLYLNCVDSNGNGIPDYLELDSDSDGIPDSVENILGSNPGKEDSDGDKTDDIIEYGICLENGTNCEDLESEAGKAKCTCPAMTNKDDNPVVRGDFVFVTPYKKDSSDPQTLSLETAIQTIDLLFMFDASSSMDGERESLRTSLPIVMRGLHCKALGGTAEDPGKICEENKDCSEFANSICSENGRCILSPSARIDYATSCQNDTDCEAYDNAFCKYTNPSDDHGNCVMEGCFDDMWTGIAGYNKINTFFMVQQFTESIETTINTLNSYTWPSVDDEAPYSGVMCAALKKGENNEFCAHTTNTCNTDEDRIGCAGFRNKAVRLILEAFDENQCYARTAANTTNNKAKCDLVKANVGQVLKNKKIRYVGLWNESWEAYKPDAYTRYDDGWTNDLVASFIGTESGSVNTSNEPFIYKAVDSELTDKAKAGIREIASLMPMDITSTVEDMPGEENAGASELVAELRVNLNLSEDVEAQGRKCAKITNTITEKINELTGAKYQGVKELLPNIVLCYDVVPVQKQEKFKPDPKVPKIYKARVKVLGDGSVLNSGVAYFLVPPEFEKQ